jgi:hypothetical protein
MRVRYAICLRAGLLLLGSVLATAQAGQGVPPRAHASTREAPPRGPQSALYSPRARRLVQSYLRLKLLEAREADLERARLVIERRLGVQALLGETPKPDAW